MASYGSYYNRERNPTMGDIVNPRDPRVTGGITTQPVGAPPQGAWPTTGTPPPADPATLDKWGRPPGHPDYGRPPQGPSGGGSPTWGVPQTPPPPPAAPNRRPHTYQGGALAYYGTGDIDGAEDLKGGSHASTGVNLAGWESKERGSNSIKNTAMKIATRYPPKPSSIDLWLNDPDTKRFFPNAKKVGFDKVDFGDGKPVDILKMADPNTDTAEAWAWMPDDESVPEGAGAGLAAWRAAGVLPPEPRTTPRDTSVSADARRAVTKRGYRGPSFRDWAYERGEA
jgi:hypothetical protein